MNRLPLSWVLLGVMLLVAGLSVWRASRDRAAVAGGPAGRLAQFPSVSGSNVLSPLGRLTTSGDIARSRSPASQSVKGSTQTSSRSLRLTNTLIPLGHLARDSHAVLLENAWLSTSQLAGPGNSKAKIADPRLPIPAPLRAQGDAGAYVVQSRAPLDDSFRAVLRAAGASIVSYIPNNAYLVRASLSAAQKLAADPHTQTVLPYEPYYKLQPALLALAVTQTPVPADSAVEVLLFPDAGAAALADLKGLGYQILAEERSPFGPLVKVRLAAAAAGASIPPSPGDLLPALARLPAVQRIELSHARVLASDLSRARLAVATNSVTPQNYLGLTGSNVLVNVNDSGVDASHPDLTNRVTSDLAISGTDTNGHGTHVAGVIAGSGSKSITVTNAIGSLMPAADLQFRGLAPAAHLFVMAADPDVGPASNTYLQETAAHTNAFISNNSWHYDNDTAYDLAAASYDAAVRDALPGVPGSQPLLFVFGAGNAGNGSDDGTGGSPGSIQSPGTAKNVITVGAIEQPRGITNQVWQCSIINGTNSCETNQPWLGMTDTSTQVAGFSGRGNVGIGIESEFGRFKPDVVAPGTFVVAARSTQWDQNSYYRPTNNSDYFEVLSNLNNGVGPFYRYESGTSMAAAEVSGVLALMQDFFQRLSRTNSPALMKALLINGARTLSGTYDFQTRTNLNLQGWGLINLTNSLPAALTNLNPSASSALLFDQTPDDALGTGQSHTRYVSVAAAATNRPLRVTLVWTDPPGNPAASLKLVNNLDLVITNLDTGEVFLGNDFPAGGSFNAPWNTSSSPNLDVVNNVENVFLAPPLGTRYSVSVLGRSIAVNAVTAQSTNVAQDYALVISSGEGQVPDALTLTDAPVASGPPPNINSLTNSFVGTTGISGAFLLNQRAGANPPLLAQGTIPWPGGPNGLIAPGTLSQWRFYVVTNDQGYTNAAFVTLRAADLSRPPASTAGTNITNAASFAADIDLYVSTNLALTSLDPTALAEASKSLRRWGTEMLVLSNANLGPYYIGVKAEDEQAAEYSFMGVFSLLPFSTQNPDGSWVLQGINLPAAIPDSTPDRPGVTNVLALATAPIPIRRVVITNEIWHESFTDLIGTLTHAQTSVVIHSNSLPPIDPVPYQYSYVYEDNGEGDIPGSQPTDGPGSLRSFIGQQGMGVWLLTMADHVPAHTGLVATVSIRLEPQNVNTGLQREVQTNAFTYDFIDVPSGATNLTVCVGNDSGMPVPLVLYLRRGSPPTQTSWDQMLAVSPPSGCLTLDLSALPPLSAGRYFIGVFNPGDTPQTIRIDASMAVDTNTVIPITWSATGPVPISDDAVSYAGLFVSNSQPVASVEARLHVDHPRISDMAFTLISPGGRRVGLFQNRGDTTTNGLGGMVPITNVPPTRIDGDYHAMTNVFNMGQNQGTLWVSYDMYSEPDDMRVFYDGNLIYDTGLVSFTNSFSLPFGPGVSTNLVIIMNEGDNANANTLWEYSATVASPAPGYVWFTENPNLAEVPIKFAPTPFVPSGADTDLFYLPEESLASFVGESAVGSWQLEMWDSRAGATNPAPRLVTWQLRFTFQNTLPVPIGLAYASPATNTIPPGQVAPFFVDVPPWAKRLTNILVYASAPVNLLFNQTNPPTGTNAGDVTLLSAATEGVATLRTGGSPPLVPGARCYLGLQNPGNSNVIASVEIVFDIFVTALTNGVAWFTTNSDAADATDYYVYTVSTNAVRAQFEINGPSADMTLVARKGLPPPTLTNYSCISANPGTNDELIVLFKSSDPVPLTPGDWYVSAVNVSGEPATYAVRATEFPVYGTNIVITEWQASPNDLCLTWTTLPGVEYYVQGKAGITGTNWVAVSPTITAPDVLASYCVPLPSPYHFFRVHEGLVVVPVVVPIRINSISMTSKGVLLSWATTATNQCQVQWTASLLPPAWNTLTNVVTPTNGAASFLDDGSQSGGLEGTRCYRLQELP